MANDNYTTLLPSVTSVDELLGNKTIDGKKTTVRIARSLITTGASEADVNAVDERVDDADAAINALESTVANKADKGTDVATGARVGVKGSNMASASTVDLNTATGDYVVVTGTTTITALGTMAAGIERTLQFAGALTLTHNATSLILPGAADIVTEAGDVVTFRSLGSGNWRCVGYQQAAGLAIPGETSEVAAIAGTAGPEGGTMTARRVRSAIENSPGLLPPGVTWEILPAGSGWKYALLLNDDRIVMGITENDTLWTNLDPSMTAPPTEVIGLLPGRSIVCWGDSLTAGAGGGGTTYPLVLSTATGLTAVNRGIGGQKSPQIAARQGGIPIEVTVTSNTIPASGGVAVTAKSVNILTNSGSYTGSQSGTLAGVDGTMSTDSAGNWTFTRANAGSSTPCPSGTVFFPTLATTHESDIAIIWSGRNDTNFAPVDTVDNIVAMVERLAPKIKQVLILSVVTGGGEYTGGETHTRVTDTNTYLKRLFPASFLDVQAHLMEYGLSENGLTPTDGDLSDIANGTIPRSLRDDQIHGNSYYYTSVGNLVARAVKARGWVY